MVLRCFLILEINLDAESFSAQFYSGTHEDILQRIFQPAFRDEPTGDVVFTLDPRRSYVPIIEILIPSAVVIPPFAMSKERGTRGPDGERVPDRIPRNVAKSLLAVGAAMASLVFE